MNNQIYSRYSSKLLFECNALTILECVEQAVAAGINLTGVDLSFTDLAGINLTGVDLSNANLIGAIMRGADLCDANLSGANLCDANLRGADLRRANLSNCAVRGTGFAWAKLDDTNLRGVDLRYAILDGVSLHHAILDGDDLREEIIEQTPISILNLSWDILITDNYMTIGWYRYTHAEWEKFTDSDILEMHNNTFVIFWTTNKNWLLGACASHNGNLARISL